MCQRVAYVIVLIKYIMSVSLRGRLSIGHNKIVSFVDLYGRMSDESHRKIIIILFFARSTLPLHCF